MGSSASLLVRCLENEGVDVVFGLPGEENIRLVRALAGSTIRYVLTRHEQSASFMAEMFGRVTGRAAVVSTTLGPGAINVQLGIADATTNSTPVVAISAQVGSDRRYKESHQYVDLVGIFAPITRWADSVPTVEAIPEMIRKAFQLAQRERPGAVYLAIPEELDSAESDRGAAPLPRRWAPRETPGAEQVHRAAEALKGARRPMVLAGHGAARDGASAALVRFAEQLRVPVANTFHGKGVMPADQPNSIGTVGFMQHDYVNCGFDRADIIVAVGYELQEFDPAKINPNTDKTIIHVHRLPSEVDAHYRVDVEIAGDIGASLDALASELAGQRFGDHGETPVRALLAEELTSGRDDNQPVPACAPTGCGRHPRGTEP